jgi:putative hydrolase of the HAD superfamily
MPNAPCIERALLVDADDTLWENNIFYLRCQARFQDLMESMGHDRDLTARTLASCEREAIPTHGYGPRGYLAALEIAGTLLLQQQGRVMSSEILGMIRQMAQIVLEPPMVLLPSVEATLSVLKPTTQLILVTKGDEETQKAKVARSGLGTYFDAQYVVAEKNARTYREIAAEQHLDPRCTWMVGNSPRSDINPAIEAGLGAILIPHNHTWLAEIEEIVCPDQVITLQRFADLVPWLGIQAEV